MPSNEKRRIKILQYVMDRQKAKQRTTKAEVIRYMRGDSAVNTTHHLIMELFREGKLNVEELNSQVHFLTVNENYDLPQYERELLVKTMAEIHSYFENITEANEGLVAFFKRVIEDDDLRSEIGFFDPEFYKIILKEKPRKKSKEKKVDIDRLTSMIK